MSTNARNARGGHHRPSGVDGTGEAPPPYARVHRDNGRDPNVLQIASEGDFWMGLAELQPWMPSFGHRAMGPILSELFKRRDKLAAQRNTLDRQVDNLSQMIDWLVFVLQPPEEDVHQDSANEHRERRRQRQDAVQHGELSGRNAFEQPAPRGTVAPEVPPLDGTGSGLNFQDEGAVDPEIWHLEDWPGLETVSENDHRS